ILSMQGILTTYTRIGAFKKNWRAFLQHFYERAWLPYATIITCESEWGRNEIKKIAPKAEIELVEYGVHPSFYQVKWQPDPRRPIFLFIGTIDYRKGMDVLLKALKSSPTKKDYEVRIIGSGEYQSSFEGLPNVRILGNLPWLSVQQELAKAWAVLLPTRADTSPNVAKEARVVGVPVVTTPYGGQSGYIQHMENGWILHPLTPENLSKAMQTLSHDFSLVRSLGARHHDRDRAYFRPERTAEGFIRLYKRMLAQ
ncbi:MAG: glycosyltransferase family 4 protein, partial [Methylacidiphilales bacterium]|nr:glycosyltransferase family 4 protein [Candidatus Methylacidiphilales bacterium]